jgi:hypothetical protein
MPRPKEYENLKMVPIMLEEGMVKELQQKNINISQACRELLEDHVMTDFKSERFVRKSKFDDIPEGIIEKYGERMLKKPWTQKGIIRILYKETGRRFFRRELWEFFKKKFPDVGEEEPDWSEPEYKPPKIHDKTKYSTHSGGNT